MPLKPRDLTHKKNKKNKKYIQRAQRTARKIEKLHQEIQRLQKDTDQNILTPWEQQWIEEVPERIRTFGRAWANPHKADPEDHENPLSLRQKRILGQLRTIHRKIKSPR